MSAAEVRPLHSKILCNAHRLLDQASQIILTKRNRKLEGYVAYVPTHIPDLQAPRSLPTGTKRRDCTTSQGKRHRRYSINGVTLQE